MAWFSAKTTTAGGFDIERDIDGVQYVACEEIKIGGHSYGLALASIVGDLWSLYTLSVIDSDGTTDASVQNPSRYCDGNKS